MSDEQLQLPVDPKFRPRRLRRRIYLLPSLFTMGNILLGYYAIAQTLQGTATEFWHFDNAAKAIGWAIFLDMLDGRLARMTQTTSDFGRELDSLADVISFGVAPALLAWIWGFRMLQLGAYTDLRFHLEHLGFVASFVFLITGAARLARFNIQVNPQPSNPGRPGKKYFVGMPIPAGAGVVAAIVHFAKGDPIFTWWLSLIWLLLLLAAAFLMVSTWRFYSFKDLDLRSRHPFTVIVLVGILIASIALFSRYALFVIGITYMLSGVVVRLFYVLRPRRSPHATPPESYTEAPEAR
ncbi:MAG TPA: CDP-diacylglycerol--serine O-phosphatidyltransferase [Terriglobales bacterium]|nr:CDP-diacylglycerol--serine O-phosphatidyltransferase [Terriglobales bacterium]